MTTKPKFLTRLDELEFNYTLKTNNRFITIHTSFGNYTLGYGRAKEMFKHLFNSSFSIPWLITKNYGKEGIAYKITNVNGQTTNVFSSLSKSPLWEFCPKIIVADAVQPHVLYNGMLEGKLGTLAPITSILLKIFDYRNKGLHLTQEGYRNFKWAINEHFLDISSHLIKFNPSSDIQECLRICEDYRNSVLRQEKISSVLEEL